MSGMTESDGYLLGRAASEIDRLRLQAEIYAPHSEHLFALAGVGPGMRVLDIGCGAGDVTMAAARLVGPSGSVIGVDLDADVLELARARAAEAGLGNVSFVRATLPDVALAEPVDALIGRLVLIHLTDPVDAVRRLTGLVRPGGVAVGLIDNSLLPKAVTGARQLSGAIIPPVNASAPNKIGRASCRERVCMLV